MGFFSAILIKYPNLDEMASMAVFEVVKFASIVKIDLALFLADHGIVFSFREKDYVLTQQKLWAKTEKKWSKKIVFIVFTIFACLYRVKKEKLSIVIANFPTTIDSDKKNYRYLAPLVQM